MKRIVRLLSLLILFSGVSFAESVEPMLDLGAGGGYDDNLNNASGDQKEGAAFASTWVLLGVSKKVFEKGSLYLDGGYEGSYFADFSDLTVSALTAKAGFLYSITDTTLIHLSPRGGVRYYGDSDRDATVYGALISVRDRISPAFSARAAYRYTRNDAKESVFSYDSHRLGVSGEIKVGADSYLTVGYAANFSQSPFYQTATAPTPSGGKGKRPSDTFGTNQVVLKTDTTAHILSVDWDQDLYRRIYLRLGYAYSFVVSDLENYTDNFISGGIGYRF